ncbi:hypothetical protein [Nocardia sp. BMG51109]|uniref:hypothetical protein n=1 Tax=Nocardia sp. BMG51109 TaxID=1056816 RepID=UPI0004631333|nr:hypothetical protein [Nocardia sp. BMG51109]
MTRIGITGHTRLDTDVAATVYGEIRRILAEAGEGAGLVGVSCIAPGADSVFAEAVLDAGGRIEVIVPARHYRDREIAPGNLAQFDRLIRCADRVRVMDFDEPGPSAYEAANNEMLGSVDRLIAVWDGRPGSRGGTGTVVESAREQRLPIAVVWPR